MDDESSENHPPIDPEDFRDYLTVLARARLRGKIRGKIDASDVVQQTLIDAHEAIGGFRGGADALAGWLRTILFHNIKNVFRDYYCGKRSIDREVPLEVQLEDDLEKSARGLERLIAPNLDTPSKVVQREDDAVRAATVIVSLPEDVQDVIIARYCEGATITAIADRMGKSAGQITRMIRGGVHTLRQRLQND